jgi:Uma2 family endonuclease
MSTFAPAKPEVVCPESGGQPIAENPRQYECIVTRQGGLDELRPDDFVGADNFWYPIEGRPDINAAPDVYVAIGRPKGYRGLYKQWGQAGVAPQVVFEVLSPGNRGPALALKQQFYERAGVEESYTYDPDDNEWRGYRRAKRGLVEIGDLGQWVSPRLGIRIDLAAPEMRVLRPDGEAFKTYPQQAPDCRAAKQQAAVAMSLAERLAATLRALGVDADN